jgi:hypothetical protein
MLRAAIVIVALLVPCGSAWSQPLYKCTNPKGAVTYQETPCSAGGSEKRMGSPRSDAVDPGARRMLELEAYRGDPLAREFLEEVRERERLEREERLRRERETPPRTVVENAEWMPPWGWAGPPGLARPKAAPAK